MSVVWFGSRFTRKTKQRLSRNLDTAAEFLSGNIKESFPASGASGTISGGGSSKNRSEPGGIPFVQTGALRASIRWERVKLLVRRIGSTLQPAQGQTHSYAMLLEYGTDGGKMEARPFLRPSLPRNRGMINKLIKK